MLTAEMVALAGKAVLAGKVAILEQFGFQSGELPL
jgi:hypothetical protein